MLGESIISVFKRTGACLVKFRGRRPVDILANAVDKFSKALENENYDFMTNGELRVLRSMSTINPHCIFDVGSNQGKWALLASRLYPSCTIHAFEILPSTFMMLSEAVKNRPHIIVNNFGLSDYNGNITINVKQDNSQTATAFKIAGYEDHDRCYTRQVVCEGRKADDYIINNNIESVDFLKIDVEGGELKVIQGFHEHIRKVRVIQFEYGYFNISSKDLLFNFYDYLTRHDFITGRIYPRYVDLSDYRIDKEKFIGGNYLSVKKDEEELIATLSKYG